MWAGHPHLVGFHFPKSVRLGNQERVSSLIICVPKSLSTHEAHFIFLPLLYSERQTAIEG